MKLQPEDLEKLRTKQLANIIRKLGENKTITAREQRLLDEAAATPAPEQSGPNYAHTWDELARILAQRLGVSITRRSLQTWRTRENLIGKWPRDRDDGRKDVEAWMRFILQHGLNRADELLEPDEIDGDEPKTLRDWREHKEKLQCQRIERWMARDDNLLLVATELEIPIGSTLMAVQNKISQFGPRVSRFMVGLRSEAEAEEKLHDETDAILADLNAAAYLDESLADILKSLPFDAETEKLFELVTFDGQDRQKLLQLIECVARETLRRIGRKSIRGCLAQSASDRVCEAQKESPTGEPEKLSDATAPPATKTEKAGPTAVAPVKDRASKSRKKRRSSTPRRKRGGRVANPER